MRASRLTVRAVALLALAAGAASASAQQPSLQKIFSNAQFPKPRSLTLAIASPPTLDQAFAAAQFPARRNLTLAIAAPPSLEQAFAGAQIPQSRGLTLAIASPPALGEAFGAAQFPLTRNLTLSISPPPPLDVASLVIAATEARAGTTSPPAVYGGVGSAQGTVTLAEALTDQVTVPLQSNNPAAVVPQNVSIPAGQTTATFPIQTIVVAADASAVISAGEGTLAKAAALVVKLWPPLLRYIDAPTTIIGGTELSVSVFCNCVTYPIALYGSGLGVSSSNPDVLKVTGGSFTEGQDFVPVVIKTEPVVTGTRVTITASFGGGTVTRNVSVEPPVPAQIVSVALNSLYEGATGTGTVTLDKAAAKGGEKIMLGSSSVVVTVPAEITIADGQTSATFTATAGAPGSATVGARREVEGVEKQVTVQVKRIEVRSMTLSPASVHAGDSTTGTVTLDSRAGADGITVRLVSVGVTVRQDVVVAPGTDSVTFIATAQPGGTGGNSRSITARRLGGAVGSVAHFAVANLTITPPTLEQALGAAQFPQPNNLTLTVTSPPRLDDLLPGAAFPQPQSLTLTVAPPPALDALLAAANIPQPNSLTLTVAPPPGFDALLAAASFPQPKNLTLTILPPPAEGTVPVAARGPTAFLVQIVQVIPRRGVNFFDRVDPAGEATVQVAQAAPVSPATPVTPVIPPVTPPVSACAVGPTSGGTFQSVTAGVNFECHSLAVVSGPGDVLAMGDLHIDFNPPGATLAALFNINSGPTFATVTGANKSTVSLTGVTSAPQGTVPAGTPIRIDGTVTAIPFDGFTNFTLTVCDAGGTVVYRRPAGDCF